MDPVTLHVIAVVFLATLVRSTFGFGEALVAVPLLALMLPVKVAAPVVVLLSITIAAVVVVQDWRKIHLRTTAWLLAPTFLGIPLGLLLLTRVHGGAVKTLLGAVLALFAGYCLMARRPPELREENYPLLIGCGFLAGILGGAYGMNGPPLVLYGGMRRWSPQHFRATLQGYFLPASLVAMAGYWWAGLWVPAVTHYYLVSIGGALPAIFLGRAANYRLHGESFLKYVYAGLIALGVLLVVQGMRQR